MPRHSVELFLQPKRVALLGVASSPDAITARPALFAARYDTGCEVTVIKDSPSSELHGVPVRRSLDEMDDVADVAMVMVPAADVLPVLRECVAAGVKGAVVISSGFEDGEGSARRAALVDFLAENREFRMVGPNCVGVTSPATATWLTFSSVVLQEQPLSGTVGLVTQSGAVGNGLLLALQRRGVGVGHWISTGNELDLGALECAEALLRREDCRAVGLFLEGVTDRRFRDRLAAAITETGKPVIAMRAAASERGKQVAMGHTGRLIGADRVARAVLEEIGVIFVDTLDELTASLTVVSLAPVRQSTAEPATVTVVTVSGATGVLAADEVDRQPGLEMAEIPNELASDLHESLGNVPGFSIANPLDVPVLGNSEVFQRTVSRLAHSQASDATVVIASTLAHDYEALSWSLSAPRSPLVVAHLSPAEDFTPEQSARLAARGVAVVRTPRDAVRALAVWAGRGCGAPQVDYGDHKVPSDAVQCGVSRTEKLLGAAIGRWLAPSRPVTDLGAALDFLRGHPGSAVVLKADGQRIAHRAELGAVAINLRTVEQVTEAHRRVARVCEDHEDGLLAQIMAASGLELMVSVLRDPEVGLALMVRPGGTLVELGGPSVILTRRREHWDEIVGGSPLGALLAGWRGASAADREALFDLLSALLDAVEQAPEIELLECNPVIVHSKESGLGATVVDLLSYTKEPNE